MGQDHIVRTLGSAVEQGRIAHAYLFSGPRGTGKTSLAKILAKALNCENGPTATPDGTCAICMRIHDAHGARRDRDGRRVAPRHRRHPRDPRTRRAAARRGPLQGLHPGRGALAHGGCIQRAAEDARGAPAPRRVRALHDRSGQAAEHDPLALPALRLPPSGAGRAREGALARVRGREDRGLRRRPAPDRSRRRGLLSRRAHDPRPALDRARRRDLGRGRRAPARPRAGAGARRPRRPRRPGRARRAAAHDRRARRERTGHARPARLAARPPAADLPAAARRGAARVGGRRARPHRRARAPGTRAAARRDAAHDRSAGGRAARHPRRLRRAHAARGRADHGRTPGRQRGPGRAAGAASSASSTPSRGAPAAAAPPAAAPPPRPAQRRSRRPPPPAPPPAPEPAAEPPPPPAAEPPARASARGGTAAGRSPARLRRSHRAPADIDAVAAGWAEALGQLSGPARGVLSASRPTAVEGSSVLVEVSAPLLSSSQRYGEQLAEAIAAAARAAAGAALRRGRTAARARRRPTAMARFPRWSCSSSCAAVSTRPRKPDEHRPAEDDEDGRADAGRHGERPGRAGRGARRGDLRRRHGQGHRVGQRRPGRHRDRSRGRRPGRGRAAAGHGPGRRHRGVPPGGGSCSRSAWAAITGGLGGLGLPGF